MLYTTFTVKDIDYKLRLSAKSTVELEKKLGTNPLNIFMEIANTNKIPELNTMITILQASLSQYQHKMDMDKTYELYDEFVDEGHNLMDLIPVIMDVFKVSGFLPEEQEEEEVKASTYSVKN